MKLITDAHTHTNYSHGKASIKEMADKAAQIGLKGIYITEHGYGHHRARNITRETYVQMRREITEMQKKYPDMDIKLGAEANIISFDGDIDIRREDIELLDFINAGFHTLVNMKDVKTTFNAHVPAVLSYRFKIKLFEDYTCRKCTQAMLKMLDKYKINMLVHPSRNYKIDITAVAKKCAETGTLMEVNDECGLLNAAQLASLKDINVNFAVGSDAHSMDKVGSCENAFMQIAESGLPVERFVNVEE